MDEGYIKFNCQWVKSKPLPIKKIDEINKCRQKLYNSGLIGAYENGVGFGNISIRNKKSFIITGSKTGGIEKLTKEHYTKVIKYNLDENNLKCKGPIKASSESMSHAAVYESSPETNSVIHIHNLEAWKKLMNKYPTTNPSIEFGTPEIAKEIKRLFKETSVNNEGIIIMGGHKEGIIGFGKTLEQARITLLKYIK